MSSYPKYNDIIGSGAGPSVQSRLYDTSTTARIPVSPLESELIRRRDNYRLILEDRNINNIPRDQREPYYHGLSQTSVNSSDSPGISGEELESRLAEILEAISRGSS